VLYFTEELEPHKPIFQLHKLITKHHDNRISAFSGLNCTKTRVATFWINQLILESKCFKFTFIAVVDMSTSLKFVRTNLIDFKICVLFKPFYQFFNQDIPNNDNSCAVSN